MGVLGKGSAKQTAMGRDVDKQGLNFLGSSLGTRLLYGVLKKKLYDKKPEMFDDFLQYFVDDAQSLTPDGDGFIGPDGEKFHLAFVGSLGDWPFHVKSGHLCRSFNNVSKTGVPQKNLMGICHECNGGQKDYPWEDFNLTAAWVLTIGLCIEAWLTDGPLLMLIRYNGARHLAYRWDLWHCWNLGAAKEFLASVYVESLKLFAGGSIDAKLDLLNADLNAFLSENKCDEGLSFVSLTKDKLSWPTTATYPRGRWQKATDTVVLHRHVICLLEKEKAKGNLDDVLDLALEASRAMDYAISELHGHGIWVPSAEGVKIATAGIVFLQTHAEIVSVCRRLKLNRFLQQPKLHAICHIFFRLWSQCQSHSHGLNPICQTVPMCEDFIGRISRSSRRVSQRLVSLRTIQAFLVQAREQWDNEFIFGKM